MQVVNIYLKNVIYVPPHIRHHLINDQINFMISCSLELFCTVASQCHSQTQITKKKKNALQKQHFKYDSIFFKTIKYYM